MVILALSMSRKPGIKSTFVVESEMKPVEESIARQTVLNRPIKHFSRRIILPRMVSQLRPQEIFIRHFVLKYNRN